VAVATNCWLAPIAVVAVAGVTAMEVRVLVTAGGGTVSDPLPETPLRVAVRVAEPAASAEARPPGVTFAVSALDDDHVADVVTFAVELSL
jgi:hypothetical protein